MNTTPTSKTIEKTGSKNAFQKTTIHGSTSVNTRTSDDKEKFLYFS